MTQPSYLRHGDEIHTHQQRRGSLLPWLVVGVLALALAIWALARRHDTDQARRLHDTPTHSMAPERNLNTQPNTQPDKQ